MDNLVATGIVRTPAMTIAIVKWFLNQYQKRGEELEKTRQSHLDHQIFEFEQLAKKLRMDIDLLKDSLIKTDKDLAVMLEKVKFQSADVERLLKAFHDYVETSSQRLSSVESKVTELSKDVFLVSNRKKGERS